MAFVETHIACPKCDSSDAFSISDNGWGKCFSCGSNIPPEKTGSTAGGNMQSSRVVPMQPRKADTEQYSKPQNIIYRDLRDRRIDVNVCEKYGVGFRGNDLVFPYGEQSQAYKVRVNNEKNFRTEGAWREASELFGQHRFNAGGKHLLVVEGEMDALAAYQMLNQKYAVVSVRNGAQSALKDCKDNYEYIDSFGSVVFMFDGDSVGQQAQRTAV